MNKLSKNKLRFVNCFCGSILIIGTLLLFTTKNLIAAPSDLDSSFGIDGKFVANTVPLSSGVIYAVLVQPNGKIILAGTASRGSAQYDFTLARLNVNGTMDSTFGTNGIVTTSFTLAESEKLFAVALQSDGKIVAAGNASTPAPASTNQFAVLRYSVDGVLDTTFGTNGRAITDFSTSLSEGISMVIQSDNKIVMAGTQNGKFALARLTSSGAKDISFGTDGKTITQIVTDGNATANVLLLQPDGKFIVAGSRTGPTSSNGSSPVARFTSNGSLDNSFDNDGLAFPRLAFIKTGAIDPLGRLLFGGQGYPSSAQDFGVARLNTNGSADMTFNGTGTSILAISNGPSNESWISSLAIQTDGKIVAAGRSYNSPGGYDFTVARFKENGIPESTFGNGGSIRTHMGAEQDWAYDLKLQADGKIIVAGSSVNRFAVARYLGGENPRPHKFDFDGDGRDDISLTRSNQSSGLSWFFNNSQTGFKAVNWGINTDKPAAADYDGDSKTDVTVFRNGIWYVLRSSNTTLMAFQFGTTGDVPVPSDYDGDSKADFAVVRNDSASGELIWYQFLSADGRFTAQNFGDLSDMVVPADYDGDGRNEIAVFRSSEGRFYISKGSRYNFDVVYWGIANDKPVVADYDGDNKADAAIFRPSIGLWCIKGSNGINQFINWGVEGDTLVPADYDGDNKADISVYRNGVWYIRQSANSQMSVTAFGLASDQPLPKL